MYVHTKINFCVYNCRNQMKRVTSFLPLRTLWLNPIVVARWDKYSNPVIVNLYFYLPSLATYNRYHYLLIVDLTSIINCLDTYIYYSFLCFFLCFFLLNKQVEGRAMLIELICLNSFIIWLEIDSLLLLCGHTLS